MRPLTEEETKTFFEKLAKYIGRNIAHLIDRPDEPYCFRMQKDKVYYVSEMIMKKAISVSREQLLALGVCFGKFTKTGKFRLHVTALDYLSQFAKAHLGRITEDTPEHQGVIVYTMADIPLGFGVTAKSTGDCRKMDPTAICVFHQTDIGEYLRDEDTLF
ncbi:hypothetical protein BASA83_006047 [Batrachochytrium salamandrivorans]|nr:hypothetical protein BASA83_006047 [Batrachochytrium salamandrivorans]